MTQTPKKSTQKTVQGKTAPPPTKERTIVRRGTKPKRGSGNILVTKRGEDLRQELEARYSAMEADLKQVEFFWDKIMSDAQFSETREWNELRPILSKWEISENVKTIIDYRGKMRRLKTLIDHFKPGYDYELTVDEVVEIGS